MSVITVLDTRHQKKSGLSNVSSIRRFTPDTSREIPLLLRVGIEQSLYLSFPGINQPLLLLKEGADLLSDQDHQPIVRVSGANVSAFPSVSSTTTSSTEVSGWL